RRHNTLEQARCPQRHLSAMAFFFQAEDGIRDFHVTGVQTCALPIFVRDDRACDFLFQCSDTTWSAYNRWPDQWSLYDDGKKQWYWGPGVRVSWDRPYGKYCQVVDAPLSQGSGEFLLWEFPLAYWMEKEGYDGEGG